MFKGFEGPTREAEQLLELVIFLPCVRVAGYVLWVFLWPGVI